MPEPIPIEQLVQGHVYRVHSRNLDLAVFDGHLGMVGIREKLGHRYLATEYLEHTAHAMQDTGVIVPPEVPLKDMLKGTVCSAHRQPARFVKKYVGSRYGVWKHIADGTDLDENDSPRSIPNEALFEFLDKLGETYV